MIFLEKISRKSEFQLSTFQRVTSLLFNGLGKSSYIKKATQDFTPKWLSYLFFLKKKS
jgi:hypothetical protein